jgi:hypothetical protein
MPAEPQQMPERVVPMRSSGPQESLVSGVPDLRYLKSMVYLRRVMSSLKISQAISIGRELLDHKTRVKTTELMQVAVKPMVRC